MDEVRPDPDQLLAHVQAEEARARRGRLRIFFGASAGVGKTYAMLEAARGLRASGTDVVVGYVEPHGRVETERLLEGLERLPSLPVSYRDIVRQEFDLDGALSRRPAILLVDELAHSNLVGGEPAPRHPKRWQDVEELLDAGINVWTTVNVQHLESLNDLIAQVTGVRPARDAAGSRVRRGERHRAHRSAARRSARATSRGQGVHRGRGGEGGRTILPHAEPDGAARARAPARGRPRRSGRSRAAARSRAHATGGRSRAGGRRPRCRRRSSSCARASEWRTRWIRSGPWSTSRRRDCCACRKRDRNRRIEVLRLAESLGAETVTLDGPSPAGSAARVRADARRHARDRRRAEAPRLARLAARLDGHAADPRGAGLRRDDHRAVGRHAGAGAQSRIRLRPTASRSAGTATAGRS